MFVVFLIHFQQAHVFFYLSSFLLRLINLVLKSVFVTKFACVGLNSAFLLSSFNSAPFIKSAVSDLFTKFLLFI